MGQGLGPTNIISIILVMRAAIQCQIVKFISMFINIAFSIVLKNW